MKEEKKSMTEEEKTLLHEIDALYNGLLRETSGYSYLRIAKELVDKVFELFNAFNPDYLSEDDISALHHSYNKEVSHVEYHFRESQRKKAAKKRYAEFIDSMRKANDQISRDIFLLLVKIKEMKEI